MLFRTSTKQATISSSLNERKLGDVLIERDVEVKGAIRDKNTITKEEYKKMKTQILQDA